MKLAQIRKAKLIAQAFIGRADKVMEEAEKNEQWYEHAPRGKNTGALRRCSMELTRQLAAMRR